LTTRPVSAGICPSGVRTLCALFALLLATCGLARAEYILLPPTDAVVAGGTLSLVLMITNDTEQAVDLDIPPRLDLRLTTDAEAFNATLSADPPSVPASVRLAAQTFRKVRYTGKLPDRLQGIATVRTREPQTNNVVVSVQPPSQPAAASVIAGSSAAADNTPSSRFLSALSTYEPVYFVVGTRVRTNAKFQLSFKYRFFNKDGPLVQRVNFLQDLYLGYTQTSLWDLESNSAPFYDSSYKPRLFYLNEDAWEWPAVRLGLGLEGGLGHESNGKSGIDSRSINIAYVKPVVTLGDRGGWHWTVSPMLIDYLEKEDNPDIDDYRGHVDLQVTFGKEDSLQLAGQFRKGTQGFSTQLDLTYPLRIVALGNLNGYFLVQYFDGYGESILDYNRRFPSQVRFGLMVVR
jgi:outer membrane phospholipase A